MTHPYDIMGFSKKQKMDYEILKARYNQLCKIMHPDKGGDAKSFSRLNKAYQKIKRGLDRREAANHQKLKAQYDKQKVEVEGTIPRCFDTGDGTLNRERFNKVFDEIKVPVTGYEDRVWKPSNLSKVTTRKSMHGTFDSMARTRHQQGALMKIPESFCETEGTYQRGADPEQECTKVDGTNSLPYTDYWAAYTKHNLISVVPETKSINTIKQMEKARRDMRLRPEMRQAMDLRDQDREVMERRQLERMEQEAQSINQQYRRLHGIMNS